MQEPVVRTTKGLIEGRVVNAIYVFKGIPYAVPPTGNLRWMPPQPISPWEGKRTAFEFGPISIQPEMAVPPPGGGFTAPEPQSEDCLYLNVWTPGLEDKKRPVMVWIHGGAFNIGSGSSPMYDCTSMAAKGDVVMVTLNYRLGELGFLRLKDITKGAIPSTGNEGLLDQVAALHWVKDTISSFGGDPDNVTVFGESAGAMSIGCLLAMPAAKGLFQKAILESGVGSTSIPLESANAAANEFLSILGIKEHDAESLMTLTTGQILEADLQMRMPAAPGGAPKLTAVAPVIDGDVITGVPNEMVKQGYCKEVATIVGTNLDEYRLFAMMEPPDTVVDDKEVKRRLSEFIEEKSIKSILSVYREYLVKRREPSGNKEILSAILTDLMFRIPALEFVEAQTMNGQKATYNYLFTWSNPNGNPLGACHALEMGFVFGALEPMFCGIGADAEKLSASIQDAWFNFARKGSPSGDLIGQWPPFGEQRITMLLGKECKAEAAPYKDVIQAWQGVTIKKSPMP